MMGCALCIGIQFPEVFSEYEQLKADCVLFSAFSEDPVFWPQAQGYAAANNLWFSLSIPAQCGGTLQGALIGHDGHCLSRRDANTTAHFLRVELDKKSPNLQVAPTNARQWRRKARMGKIYESGFAADKKTKTHCVLTGKLYL